MYSNSQTESCCTQSIVIRKLVSTLGLLLLPLLTLSMHSHANDALQLSASRAPVAPDGTTSGATTDILITFRDRDPLVAGLEMKAGGTISITLPSDFTNTGLPVLATGSRDECKPPHLKACSTAVIVQGWPQSPVPPFPNVSLDAESNTFILTIIKDWMSNGESSPGPKAVHLAALGFRNPEQPGDYTLKVKIQPDPSNPEILEGNVNITILQDSMATIAPNSLSNGKAPPPFANTLFQSIPIGEISLKMAFYLWDEQGNALVGADVIMDDRNKGKIVDAAGSIIGSVLIVGPAKSDKHEFVTEGPSKKVKAFVTGISTGRLIAQLQTDKDAPGEYQVTLKLNKGNSLVHIIKAN